MSCDVGEVTESLENEQSFTYYIFFVLSSSLVLTIHISMDGSPGDVREEPVT